MTDIYCDGSTTNICYIIGKRKPVIKPATPEGSKVTVNVGEYYAVLHALEAAKRQGLKELVIHTDSQLLVRQLTPDEAGRFVYRTKDRRLQQLRRLVQMLAKGFESVEFKWVRKKDSKAGWYLP